MPHRLFFPVYSFFGSRCVAAVLRIQDLRLTLTWALTVSLSIRLLPMAIKFSADFTVITVRMAARK